MNTKLVTELTAHEHHERQYFEISKEGLQKRLPYLKKAQKFEFKNSKWHPLSYPGFAIVSMVNSNPDNDGLSKELSSIQLRLAKAAEIPAKMYLLPSASFHQTMANTLSAERFEKHIVKPGLVKAFPGMVEQAMQEIPVSLETTPIAMEIIGLSIFSGAIGLLGDFSASDFQRINAFRDSIYSSSVLQEVGIRRTRPFIGHITLAYLEDELTSVEKDRLWKVCYMINQQLSEKKLTFQISNTELRRYDHLAEFRREALFPSYSFIKK